MMIGSQRRYGISYKQNEKHFAMYTRKFLHNLKVCVDEKNYAGSTAIEVPSSDLIIVTKVDTLLFYDNTTY